jgi:Xaa-Pro aminopeptidase
MKADKVKRNAARRRGVLRQATKNHGVEAVLITNTTDIRYLSGCHEGGAGLLFGAGWSVIFTGKMFAEVVPDEAPGVDVCIMKEGLYKALAAALRKHKHRRALGFQGNSMTWAQQQAMGKALGRRKLVSIADTVVDYRAVKDDAEIRLIRKCVRIAEDAFLELTGRGLGHIVGKTEKHLAAEFEYIMRQGGADRQGFPFNGIIVASGPNSASCHHRPTTRKVRRDEPLLFDWGAELDGYRSDITRTLFTGTVSERFREIYNTVLAAHDVGVKAMKPGVRCGTVAKTAWDVVRDAGYGETIRHGLGHGLGMDVHERPGFGNGTRNELRKIRLRKNMVLTIEPGIYFKGEGGVRIEDDIVVTATGRRRLNRLPRDLDSMILQ